MYLFPSEWLYLDFHILPTFIFGALLTTTTTK